MIYKDLKPENILLGEDGYVCLTDFGIARLPIEKLDRKKLNGTPEYFGIVDPDFTQFLFD